MLKPLRETSAPTVLAAFALAGLTIGSIGCRGNLGSAIAVATGRVEIESLQTLTAQRAAQADPAAMMTGGAYPDVDPAAVNQAAFKPGGLSASANLFAAVDPVTGNPAPPPTRDEALAAVLPELQRLAEVNPAAQQRLIAQMQTADPAHWPLLIRRLNADLAVHHQLNQANEADTQEAEHASHHDAHGHEAHGHGAQQRGSGARSTAVAPQAAAPIAPSTDLATANDFPVQQASHNAPANHGSGSRTTAAFSPPPITPTAETPAVFNAGHDRPMAKLVTAHAPAGAPRTASDAGSATRRPQPKVIENHLATVGATVPVERLQWRDALRQAITDLDQTAPNQPQSAGEAYQHARLRLMQLAAGDIDGAASAIPGLSSTEQSYWSHQLFAIAKLMDERAHPETESRATSANLHLARAAADLDALSSLTVRSLAFCDKVYGFGAYDPIDNPSFKPGDSPTLYAEVRNYKSTRVGDGLHAATLASSFQLVDSRGVTVDSGDFPLVEDECLSKRRDFHIQYTFKLPEALRPGVYRLRLTVEDRLGNKRGNGSIDLAIE